MNLSFICDPFRKTDEQKSSLTSIKNGFKDAIDGILKCKTDKVKNGAKSTVSGIVTYIKETIKDSTKLY